MRCVDVYYYYYFQFAVACRWEMHYVNVSSDWNSGLKDCGLDNDGNGGEIRCLDLKISPDGLQFGTSLRLESRSKMHDVERVVEDLNLSLAIGMRAIQSCVCGQMAVVHRI